MLSTLKKGIFAAFMAFVLVGMGLSAPAVQASELSLSIPVSTVVSGDEDSTRKLASESVAADMQGLECRVSAQAENQSSVHPGNDLVIASGGDSVVLEDVERAPGVLTNASGTLPLGTDVVVSLVFGPHEIFSGGMTVDVTCDEPEVPEFSAMVACTVVNDLAVYTLHVNEATNVSASYDPTDGTLLPNGDPVEVTATYANGARQVTVTADGADDCTPTKIKVCRGDEVIIINEEDRLPTDTNDLDNCGVEEIKVCRDGAIITINEDERLPTDTDDFDKCGVEKIKVCRDNKIITIDEDEKLSTDTTDLENCEDIPKELPKTGPGVAIMSFLGFGTFATAMRSWRTSKNDLNDSLLR